MVDAAVAVNASYGGLGPLRGEELVAPPDDVARGSLGPQSGRNPARLGETAWRLADELGWAKTYDAEYLALAQLLRCRTVTVDSRLRRGADRLGLVVLPSEV